MMAPLAYIQKQMLPLQGTVPNANFIAEWKGLSEDDKTTLKEWATKEQEALEAEQK